MKKITMALGFVMLFMMTITGTYAYNQNTGFILSPEVYAGSTTRGSTYSLTSASAPVTGNETAVAFNNLGTLRSSVVNNPNRYLYITLMEDDMEPNEDEEVKLYLGTIEDYKLKKIVFTGLGSGGNGNIDSANDATAELYLKVYMPFLTGDKTTTNGPMFSYDIRVS